MISGITSTTSAPVLLSLLEQRRQDGPVFTNGIESGSGNFSDVSSLWHGGIGYAFSASDSSTSLSRLTQEQCDGILAVDLNVLKTSSIRRFVRCLAPSY